MTARRYLAGNWKMNLGLADALALYRGVADGAKGYPATRILIFPPFTALVALAEARRDGEPAIGAQNCHFETSGAFTGEVSAEQAKDAGAEFVLVGHSERRRLFCENDLLTRQKLSAAWRAGLTPVLCVGETMVERGRRETRDILARQIQRALEGANSRAPLLVAYEPVWAIGTGVVATPDEVAEAHGWVREEVLASGRDVENEATPVLYGGSVDSKTARPLARLDGVDGFLVGGASLKAASFLAIAEAMETPEPRASAAN
jgi:triosephosphate isomerase